MVKKHINLIALFAAVFAVGALATPKSFVFQHEIGLFLWQPDYFRDVFAGGFPVCTLLGDYLVQFYKFPLVGPLCTALIVCGIFLMLKGILGRFWRFGEICALALSLVAWFFIARSTTPIIGLAVLLIIAALSVLMAVLWRIFAPSRKAAQMKQAPAISLAVVAVAAVIIVADPVIRNLETWARIETAARQSKWDKVLKAATPKAAAKDREMVPYALMAASAKGQLPSALTRYKVANPGEMDFFGVQNRRGYYFESLLSEQVGCTNEAVHNIFQCACHMHRGTSFVVLLQLVRYNIELGNYTMVRKYCEVLRRSTVYRSTANKILAMYAGKADEIVDSGPAATTAHITENPMINLAFMGQAGLKAPVIAARYNAYGKVLGLTK